jgi:UDP-N-acetylglucosamine acyltransferase
MAKISNLAFVHPGAKLADDVVVDAFAYIDDDVVIGSGCHVRPHASVLAGARIGKNNEIFEGAIISATPQDFRWKGARSFVEIGDNNKIREQVIINRSIHENGKTVIGNNSFVMAQTHIGHDTEIGDYCVLGNSAKIAGDVKIGNYSILSSHALVHEKCHVGEWVLIKGGCRVNGNVPPYVVMAHNPITYFGVNAFVLKKGKKTDEIIDDIAKCYRHLYQNNTSVFNALRRMREDVDPSAERDAIIDFIESHGMQLAALPHVEID